MSQEPEITRSIAAQADHPPFEQRKWTPGSGTNSRPNAAHHAAHPPAKPKAACARWLPDDNRYCGATENLRHYQIGHLCPDHQPERTAA